MGYRKALRARESDAFKSWIQQVKAKQLLYGSASLFESANPCMLAVVCPNVAFKARWRDGISASEVDNDMVFRKMLEQIHRHRTLHQVKKPCVEVRQILGVYSVDRE